LPFLYERTLQQFRTNHGEQVNGTLQHLIGTQFQIATNTELVHVPYKGSAPLTLALLGGQVNMSFDAVPPVIEHIRQDKLKPLAVMGKERNPLLPDVPTFAELGYPGFEYDTWNGILAPAGTPPEVINKLSEEILRVVRSPEFQKRMTDAGLITLGSTPKEFKAKITDERARLSEIVKRGNVSIDQ
jgi:tripartite-type tricarboxylate transporter receptor subunit TctC